MSWYWTYRTLLLEHQTRFSGFCNVEYFQGVILNHEANLRGSRLKASWQEHNDYFLCQRASEATPPSRALYPYALTNSACLIVEVFFLFFSFVFYQDIRFFRLMHPLQSGSPAAETFTSRNDWWEKKEGNRSRHKKMIKSSYITFCISAYLCSVWTNTRRLWGCAEITIPLCIVSNYDPNSKVLERNKNRLWWFKPTLNLTLSICSNKAGTGATQYWDTCLEHSTVEYHDWV